MNELIEGEPLRCQVVFFFKFPVFPLGEGKITNCNVGRVGWLSFACMYCIKLTPIMYMLTSMEAGNVTTAVQLMTILHLIPTRGTAKHVNMICVRCVPDTVMSVSLKTT